MGAGRDPSGDDTCGAHASRNRRATASPVGGSIIEAWCVTTHSGSRYRLLHDDRDMWWLGGDNVANPISCKLPSGRYWCIQPPVPWPPVIGGSLWLEAPDDLVPGDEARIPGGGKLTSPVRRVEALLGAEPPAATS